MLNKNRQGILDKIDNFFLRNKILFFIAVFIILFLRRPTEFLFTYVWNEDGTWNIPHYLEYGVLTFLEPVQGYLVLPPKLINFISLSLSFAYYPEISIILSVIFCAFCLYSIAYSPSALKYKALCAICVLFVPTDPEVFVLPQYTFWWGTLLLFVAMLWEKEEASVKRCIFLIIGALSSPVVILMLPIFIIRFVCNKSREAFAFLLAVLILALIQGYFVLFNAQTTELHLLDILLSIPDILNKFVAQFLVRHIPTEYGVPLAILLTGYLTFLYFKHRNIGNRYYLVLLAALFLVILSSIKRAPVQSIDPYLAGPRYFFFPYILLFWILLWNSFFLKKDQYNGAFLIVILSIPIFNSISNFSKMTSSPDWRQHVKACIDNSIYDIPIHTDGLYEHFWDLKLTNAQCRTLLENSLFDSLFFNYSKDSKISNVWHSFDKSEEFAKEQVPLTKLYGSWRLNSFPIQIEKNGHMLSSWIDSDSNTGSQQAEFTAISTVSKISYVTGPVSQRQTITIIDPKINNRVLHVTLRKSEKVGYLVFETEIGKKYNVIATDNGNDWGEWSAIEVE